MSAAVQQVNPNSDVIGAKHALMMNASAAKGLQEVLKTNLGPKGTMKMLVSGAGTIKLTKDGKVLLDEMQIQHPTASIIARTATAQDDITGDGTTSNVLLTGELLKQAERHLSENLHPRVIVEGFEKARDRVLELLEKFKIEQKGPYSKDVLMAVCRTSLRTKLPEDVADHLTEIVTSAVMTIHKEGESPDLHMVEIMAMKHKTALDSQYVDGLVLDHGARHPDMAKRNENAYLLVANVSLEYEKTEINSGFFYKNADERQKMATAERKFTDERVNKIIDLKKKVCVGDRKDYSFIVINQKGIDPISLDMLQKHNIVGIRRCKRRNMERLSKACGGSAINSLEDMDDTCLGFAKCVYEHQLGEEVFTFVEGCKNPTSCTILLKGPNEHTINQLKDAVHDGLRAVFNAIEDQSLVPGAGAFELAAHEDLQAFKITVPGRAKLGVEAFANAMLCIPKTLAQNAGYDAQTVIVDVLDQMRAQKDSKVVVGVDLDTGKAMDPRLKGIWDNYRVKKQFLHLGSLIAIKLLLVDEVMRAGRKMGKG